MTSPPGTVRILIVVLNERSHDYIEWMSSVLDPHNKGRVEDRVGDHSHDGDLH